MAIDYTHKRDLEKYVQDNIAEINNKITDFKRDEDNGVMYNSTDIKKYLKKKLSEEIENVKEDLLSDFVSENCVKERIPQLATKYVFYKKDVESKLESLMFEKMASSISDDISEKMTSLISEESGLEASEKKFLKKSLTAITKKTTRLTLGNGFCVNINNLDEGVMVANAGDSAQFLFIARAILAGYNCSNVDVRSSRYDAVIDFEGQIFKVQVKGISGDMISFKDRDRGGEGIDPSNPRNVGQRITSADCDIYVAVDKKVGLCYIIPMKLIDPWPDDKIKSVSVNKLEEYLENWDIINKLHSGEI